MLKLEIIHKTAHINCHLQVNNLLNQFQFTEEWFYQLLNLTQQFTQEWFNKLIRCNNLRMLFQQFHETCSCFMNDAHYLYEEQFM